MPATLFKEPPVKAPLLIPDRLMNPFISTDIHQEDILYPSEDGKLMAGSDVQRDPLTYSIDSIKWHFFSRNDVYVSGDLLIYYEKGTSKSVAPDVFIVFDVPNHPRKTFMVWEEGKGPDVVLEIISPTTWRKDVQDNPKLYRRLGVKEYFLYDPLEKFIEPALQGYRLDKSGQYQALLVDSLADGGIKVGSQLLGLELHLNQEGQFRLFNPQTGEYLSTYQESNEARQQAEAERQAEAEARQQAEAARQQAEAERQAEAEARQQAEAERQQAEAERQAEAEARQQAEAERQAEAEARQQAEAARQDMERKLREAEEKLRQAGLL